MYFIEICAYYLHDCLIRHKTGKYSNVNAQAAVIVFTLVYLNYFCWREEKKRNKLKVHKYPDYKVRKSKVGFSIKPNYESHHCIYDHSRLFLWPVIHTKLVKPWQRVKKKNKKNTQFWCTKLRGFEVEGIWRALGPLSLYFIDVNMKTPCPQRMSWKESRRMDILILPSSSMTHDLIQIKAQYQAIAFIFTLWRQWDYAHCLHSVN